MVSFQAKIGTKRLRKRENKNYCSFPFQPVAYRKFQKNRKKFKNTIMASFQANIGWKSMTKRENKYYRSNPFLPNA